MGCDGASCYLFLGFPTLISNCYNAFLVLVGLFDGVGELVGETPPPFSQLEDKTVYV